MTDRGWLAAIVVGALVWGFAAIGAFTTFEWLARIALLGAFLNACAFAALLCFVFFLFWLWVRTWNLD